MLNALEKGDKMQLNTVLRNYKMPNGAVNFKMVLSIPQTERIPQLVNSDGYEKIHNLIVAAIQLAMESLNLANSLNAAQIFDLADTLIDSSNEDYLALQDVVLFLQKLVRGDMGALYSQMDMAKFMELFEVYREERFQTISVVREEQQVQYKALGDPERWSETHDKEQENSMHEAMKQYMQQKANSQDGQISTT